ncbi:hypothetical protein AYO40_02200 [Planctomycetaceae bacterium SCGC AG-212-D15]|nr:hypothetical protein AYO40_02200 [Planctomycetaceae bacterium SCGC AG-212-D15]
MTDPTQERLLEAAAEVFAEKGFKAASIRLICKQAGANIAAVNYYFGDKERLYIEAVKFAHRGCVEGMHFPQWTPETPAIDKLRDFIRMMVTNMMTPRSVASTQLMMRELAHPTAACVEVVRDYIRPIAGRLGAIIAELRPDLPEQQRILVAFSVVGQCLFYRTQRPVASLLIGEDAFAKLSVDVVAEHISGFTLRALGVDEPSRPTPVPTQGVRS